MTPEEWRNVPSAQGYMVSNAGKVRGPRGELKPVKHSGGYLQVTLDRRKRMLVHRLVLIAFCGPCPPLHECRHLNGLKTDNRFENLRWGTKRENCSDRKLHGTENIGERNGQSKIGPSTVAMIRDSNVSAPELSETTGLSVSHVRQIMCGGHWTNLPVPAPRARLHANRGERNGQCKLNEEHVIAIRSSDESQSSLARTFGVSQGTISRIKLRKKWAYIP